MKTLLLLRHAKSDRTNPDLPDQDRPLNKRGREDSARLGDFLHDENLLPDLIISSTAKRARQTVKELAARSGYEGTVKERPDFYLNGLNAYLEALRELPGKCQSVMLVGHNPDMERFVQHVTGTETSMPTAALARVELPIGDWPELTERSEGFLKRVWRPQDLPAGRPKNNL